METLAVVEALLRIILLMVPDRSQLKGHLDRVAVRMANEEADEIERRRFGQASSPPAQ